MSTGNSADTSATPHLKAIDLSKDTLRHASLHGELGKQVLRARVSSVNLRGQKDAGCKSR